MGRREYLSTFYKVLRPLPPPVIDNLTCSQIAALLDLDEVPTETVHRVQPVPFEDRPLTPSRPSAVSRG